MQADDLSYRKRRGKSAEQRSSYRHSLHPPQRRRVVPLVFQPPVLRDRVFPDPKASPETARVHYDGGSHSPSDGCPPSPQACRGTYRTDYGYQCRCSDRSATLERRRFHHSASRDHPGNDAPCTFALLDRKNTDLRSSSAAACSYFVST